MLDGTRQSLHSPDTRVSLNRSTDGPAVLFMVTRPHGRASRNARYAPDDWAAGSPRQVAAGELTRNENEMRPERHRHGASLSGFGLPVDEPLAELLARLDRRRELSLRQAEERRRRREALVHLRLV